MTSSANYLNLALAAAGVHDSLVEILPEEAEACAFPCFRPANEGEASLQNVWYGSRPEVSLVSFLLRRDGKSTFLRGGGNFFLVYWNKDLDLAVSLLEVPLLYTPGCREGRREFFRGGGSQASDFLLNDLIQDAREVGRLLHWPVLHLSIDNHQDSLVDTLSAGYKPTESLKGVYYRVHLVDGHLRSQAVPDNHPLRLPVNRDHRSKSLGLFSSEITGEANWRKDLTIYVRPQMVHPCGGEWYEIQKRFSGLDLRAEVEKFQIFVKSLTGKSMLVWVTAEDTGETLKNMVVKIEGYSQSSFYFLHEGKVLHEGEQLKHSKIHKNSIIHMRYRLRGGSKGTGPTSYKEAARSKGPQTEVTPTVQPSPYIVEKLEFTPLLEIKNDQVKGLFRSLQAEAVIYRFNGFWPKSQELHGWIHQNWTANCQISLCSKGFFIVLFDSPDEYQKVFIQGPWFWGRAGLFITPWFPEFDANTMVVTKMPVWVRLPNFPLPYWQHTVLEDIGNLLGRFIKSDNERKDKGLFTYARICVEIDLNKGLLDRLYLKHESYTWLQSLDYENTAFKCRLCHLTGHLQDTCPLAKKFPKKKKGPMSNRKNWQADFPYPEEEEGGAEAEQQSMQRNEETLVPDDAEAQSTGKQTSGEDTQTNLENMKDASDSSQKHMDGSLPGEGTQTALVIHKEASTNGFKRGHESDKSDSDKEHPTSQKPEMVNGRQVIIARTSQGRWMEVKNKRKGKKGKLEAYYQP